MILKPDDVLTELARHAETVVDGLPHRLFSQHHRSKALLYTWLAWQKRPGQTMDVAVNGDLLNFESDDLNRFLNWLTQTFQLKDVKTFWA